MSCPLRPPRSSVCGVASGPRALATRFCRAARALGALRLVASVIVDEVRAGATAAAADASAAKALVMALECRGRGPAGCGRGIQMARRPPLGGLARHWNGNVGAQGLADLGNKCRRRCHDGICTGVNSRGKWPGWSCDGADDRRRRPGWTRDGAGDRRKRPEWICDGANGRGEGPGWARDGAGGRSKRLG